MDELVLAVLAGKCSLDTVHALGLPRGHRAAGGGAVLGARGAEHGEVELYHVCCIHGHHPYTYMYLPTY